MEKTTRFSFVFQSVMISASKHHQTGFDVRKGRKIMSIIVLNAPAPRSSWSRAVLDWLRQARVALQLPQQNAALLDVEDLSDRQLRDIGGERRDVSRAVDREVGRLGLLDIGWQRNRQW
jgi:uncharacterized protein YjiS (DUF1127 family)